MSETHTFIQGNWILDHDISILRPQGILSVSLFLLGIWLAWEIGLSIVSQDLTAIAYVALGFVAVGVAVTDSAKLATGILFLPRLAPIRRFNA